MSSINRIKLHNRVLSECVLMLEQIEILLSYNNLNTEEIFCELSFNDCFRHLDFLKKVSSPQELEASLCSCRELRSEDKELLTKYFSLMGKSDLNGQLKNCRMFRDLLKRNLDSSIMKENQECKSTGIIISGIGFLFVIVLS